MEFSSETESFSAVCSIFRVSISFLCATKLLEFNSNKCLATLSASFLSRKLSLSLNHFFSSSGFNFVHSTICINSLLSLIHFVFGLIDSEILSIIILILFMLSKSIFSNVSERAFGNLPSL